MELITYMLIQIHIIRHSWEWSQAVHRHLILLVFTSLLTLPVRNVLSEIYELQGLKVLD